MYGIIEYDDLDEETILVDVRSPGEYLEYTIPDAINIPILDNEERKAVGTVYRQESAEAAKSLGIKIVSSKLPDIYESILNLKKTNKNIVLFCERGGLRSSTLFELFNAMDMGVKKLKGGYKGYRNMVNKELPQINSQKTYIVLHGFTGTGKTELLKALMEKGCDVLDLEGKANHRGSILGKVGLNKEISQKQFEAELFKTLKDAKTKNVIIEAESRRIGKLFVPEFILEKMKEGIHILIESTIDVRAETILKEYIQNESSKEEIIEALEKLRRFISNEIVDILVKEVKDNKYKEVAIKLMELYYDPMYNHTQKNYDYSLIVNSDNLSKACAKLEEYYKKLEL